MYVLVIDVGGTHVKVLATGQSEPRKFDSGPAMTARQMAAGVLRLVGTWPYEAASIGYPPDVVNVGRITTTP